MNRTLIGFAALLCLSVSVCADEPAVVQGKVDVPQFDVVAHDPVIVKEGDLYYLFTTGPGVSVWVSSDMQNWTMGEPVFDPLPDWTVETVSGFNGHMWAPDINYINGTYFLYYSVSSFGTNDSCIGLATNQTLDPDSPDFEWFDNGIVLQSKPGVDDWNAIDPNLVFDEEGRPFLAFGSFWSGLKLVELAEDLTTVLDQGAEPVGIASRVVESSSQTEVSIEAGNGAIEGPFIYRKNEYYYLFASVDYCCRGKDSTYKMIYGRSNNISGPYVDKEDRLLLEGGGSLLKGGDDRWHGVGHNAVSEIDGIEYAIFHGYDGETERGLPKLHIETLGWTEDDWPYLLESRNPKEK